MKRNYKLTERMKIFITLSLSKDRVYSIKKRIIEKNNLFLLVHNVADTTLSIGSKK